MPYIISLLQDGLSVSEANLSIGNGREGWTLGAALAEGGRVGIGRPVLEQVGVGGGCIACIQSIPVTAVQAVQAQAIAGQGMAGKRLHDWYRAAVCPSPIAFLVTPHRNFKLSFMNERSASLRICSQHASRHAVLQKLICHFRSAILPLQGAWDLAIWAKYFAVAVLVLCLLGAVSALVSKV